MIKYIKKSKFIHICVTLSCTDENNYMIRSCFIPIEYYCVEATALSVLVKSYPLRQIGSDVGCIDIDVFPEDSTDSLFLSFHSERSSYSSAVLVFHILTTNQKGLRSGTILS